MTEDDARQRIASNVSRGTFDLLEQLASLVIDENARQNLIAPSTVPSIWSRHILDSAQLVWLADGQPGTWLDIGSGGGFPGLVVAIMRDAPTILAEPRAKRAAFLIEAAALLGMASRTRVAQCRVEKTKAEPAHVVSARAVAALPGLFQMAEALVAPDALWLLPKGRSAADEVAQAEREWQGDMRLVPSLSDPESAVVVARGVRRKCG